MERSVINMVSLAAFRSIPIVPGYGSAKAGLATLTGNLAKQWSPQGIRVNAVAPGVIDTPMTAPMAAFPELLDAELSRIPMGRLGTPRRSSVPCSSWPARAAGYVTGHIPRRRRRLSPHLNHDCAHTPLPRRHRGP